MTAPKPFPWLNTRMVPAAAQLVGAVHDYGPEDVEYTLEQVPDADREQLLITLAAMVDPDRTPKQLLGWTSIGPIPSRPELAICRSDTAISEIAPPLKPAPRKRAKDVIGDHPEPTRVRKHPSGKNWVVRCGYEGCSYEARNDGLPRHYRVHHTGEPYHTAPPRPVDTTIVEELVTGIRTLPSTVAERDAAVVQLTEQGMSNKDIAARIGINERTVTMSRTRADRGG